MKNTLGSSVTATLFGESHGPAVGVVLDGLAPGIAVHEEAIAAQLTRRRPAGLTDTARREPDRFYILSGVWNGRTTGTPICLTIPNEDVRNADYDYGPARPSHADYTAYCKYHGWEDYRGGGHFSGRVTAALVAAGGILIPALEQLNIRIGTHVLCCAGEYDRSFESLPEDLEHLQTKESPVLDDSAWDRMKEKILQAKSEGDSVGGVTQTAVCGLPAGLGEPWFDSVESMLSHALFSIGGIKGVEFGDGFDLAAGRGSICNDEWAWNGKKAVTRTNHNGGILGGITSGMPVLFRCAVKPTPSISKAQRTVNFLRHTEETVTLRGRHDPAIVRRICPVLDSVTALVLCDLLAQRFGTDVLTKGVLECVTD